MTIETAEPAAVSDVASLKSPKSPKSPNSLTSPTSNPPKPLDAEDAKEQLRATLRSRRRSRHRHCEHGHDAVCEAFTERALEALDGAGAVAAYVSVGHEPCTRLLLDRLAEQGVAVLLPVLGPHLARSWGSFRSAGDLAERAPGRPPEPGGEALPAEDPGDLSEAVEQDLAFHRRLCELSGNGLLLAKWLELQDQMRIVIVAGAMNEGADIPVIVPRANHEPLVRTLRSGGEDEIIRAFADHMSRAGSFWVSRMGA